MRLKERRDFFSWGIVAYAACFFLSYKALFELSYADGFYQFKYWVYALIIVHVFALLWCMVGCLLQLMPRELASFVCAALLVVGLELLSPESMKLHFWLHKSEYVARISVAQPSRAGQVSIVLYRYTYHLPSMPGGHECSTEIVYDNSDNIRAIALTDEGQAAVSKIDRNFYLRYLCVD